MFLVKQRQTDLMNKCIARKGEAWCESKLGKIFSRINYRLNWVQEKFVKLQYNLILKELALFYRQNWVKSAGYDIIKKDIEYLINNL